MPIHEAVEPLILAQNTHVLEFCARIKRSEAQPKQQLLYYDSGVGTLATSKPTLAQRAHILSDILFAQYVFIFTVVHYGFSRNACSSFDSRVLHAYRWVSDHYEPGDWLFVIGTPLLSLLFLWALMVSSQASRVVHTKQRHLLQ